MRTNHRNLMLTFGTGAGVLLVAAFLPMPVAFADEFGFTPDTSTFVPSQVEGYPPLIDEVTGAEQWAFSNFTTGANPFGDVLTGTDTETTIGSFTNDDFLSSSSSSFTLHGSSTAFDLTPGAQLDIANFGLGFENAWMDVASGPNAGVSDLLITPFGDFELFGTGFSDLATATG
jgi:hypothetical protein